MRQEDSALRLFWEDAKVRARLSPADGYFGRSANDTVLPAAWSFGESREEADRFVEEVLAGRRTATAGPRSDHEELPEHGTMSILLDGTGKPRALIVTTQVQVLTFADLQQVDAEAARAAGATSAPRPDPQTPMVLETFRLLVPKPPRRT